MNNQERELLEKLHNNVFHIGKSLDTIKGYFKFFFWVWIITTVLNVLIALLS